MKILKILANNYKNCGDNFTIDFKARSKKTSADKLYELQEIDVNLYTFNINAIVGKNASGKTTVIELLNCCYSILGTFHLDEKHFNCDNMNLTIYFYHDKNIYKYYTELASNMSESNRVLFKNQKIYYKPYYKTKAAEIYLDNFIEYNAAGELPDDTSMLFFLLKKYETRAVYFDCYGKSADTYNMIFKAMKKYKISGDVLLTIIKIFDESIKGFSMLDEHNFEINISNYVEKMSDKELLYRLSSGTTKGILLYIYVYASLKNGFDLLIDEIENHFHKTLVENMIALYRDNNVNKNKATLIFTTHYCELLDLFNRNDNIWITTNDKVIQIKNLYDDFQIRADLLKSKKFYENAFNTAVNYEELMNLKRVLLND